MDGPKKLSKTPSGRQRAERRFSIKASVTSRPLRDDQGRPRAGAAEVEISLTETDVRQIGEALKLLSQVMKPNSLLRAGG
jgi:hypothetical protein